MTTKLSGWQRLWVLFSSLYLILVVGFVAVELPRPEKIPPSAALLKKLSPASQVRLLPNDKWQYADEWSADVDMPNGERLSFRKGVPEQDRALTTSEYWSIVSTEARERRLSFLGYAAVWWIVPCFAVYILGWAVGWVYRGFRSPTNSAL